MKSTDIESYQELKEKLDQKGRTFVLIYKGDAEQSQCASERLSELEAGEILLRVDVTTVGDVHGPLRVDTAPSLVIFDRGQVSNILKGCQTASTYQSVVEGLRIGAGNEEQGRVSKQVTMYSTPTCSWCTTLKTYLDQNRVAYREVNVATDQSAAKAMVSKSGQQGVPQLEVNGQMVVGFDKARINTLLELN